MKKPDNAILIIFGASGDLTSRKIIPALYSLKVQNILPENFIILGVSRTKFSVETFRDMMRKGIESFAEEKELNEDYLNSFLDQIFYSSIDINSTDDYQKLKNILFEIDQKYSTKGNYLFYFALPPDISEVIAGKLGIAGLNSQSEGFRRIIVEKPFGHDLESSRTLDKKLLEFFNESQIFRIDHYLGKETVQNLLVTRFSNGIFEPLWNRNYIHHVEITSAENIGVEDRGKYYDSSGALRDMVQNHLMQLAGFTAMEPPSSLDSNSIRNEILKVFQSLRPIKEDDVSKYVIRGQYTASKVRGQNIIGYREEKDISPESRTETFLAMKFYIDNWRWGGIPFYIRTGKRLPTRVTEIVVHFKPTPHYLYSIDDASNSCNQLIIRIQPDEGILLKFNTKLPGAGFKINNVNMDFHYKDLLDVRIPSAYERLLYDFMINDSTLFSRGDMVEAAWKFVAPIQSAWANDPTIKIYGYPAGTWGPENADSLFDEKNISWRYPCKNLTDDGAYCEL
jgi:glucose-6-phosphate 1-dehydrogenase